VAVHGGGVHGDRVSRAHDDGVGDRHRPAARRRVPHRTLGRPQSRSCREGRELGWFPVPLLAIVLFLIAASQVEAVLDSFPFLGDIFVACVVFLVGAAVCGLVIGRAFDLPVAQARTLVFTFATRNSFVVLPFALALPAAWEMTAIVIVFQSLIELFGMLAFLWLVPRKLLPARA
jgi:ACR3 family arsenite efflux pump ArsB